MRVAVVVATRDRPVMLDRCLTSVRASLTDDDELIVVDSFSVDETGVAEVARRHGAVLLRADRPGVNRARNLGWRAASAPLVLFTDDDVVVDPGWAATFAEGIGMHGFATGRVSAMGKNQHRVAVKDDDVDTLLTVRSQAPLGHGASTAVLRSALMRIGGWDELLGSGARFPGAPETDLYDRLLDGGMSGVYVSGARAWHDQWRSGRQVARLQVRYAIGVGARLSKVLRSNRAHLSYALRDAFWDWGLRPLVGAARRGDAVQAAAALVRFGGYAVGFLLATTYTVEGGHLTKRR